MRTVEEHRAAILAAVRPAPARLVPVDDAAGLVLAADVRAALALPPFDNSAMDGYAVLVADAAGASPERPVVLRVIADLPAGSAEDPALEPGTCARIMTGAPVPRAAEAVVPVEVTDGGTDVVAITAPARPGQHVRRAGEDVRVGDPVLPAGVVLGPAQVAAVAATGHGAVLAHPRPRVAVISTGSELVPPGRGGGDRSGSAGEAGLQRGLIPDSNSFLLAAAVREAGCDVVRVGAVPDDAARLAVVLEALLAGGSVLAGGSGRGFGPWGEGGAGGESAEANPWGVLGPVDAVITSGGVSVGAYDVLKALFAGPGSGPATGAGSAAGAESATVGSATGGESATVGSATGGESATVGSATGGESATGVGSATGVEFTTVAMQPGKPQGFGTLRRPDGAAVPLFALPGNPVSAFVSFEVFVRPALLAMRGLGGGGLASAGRLGGGGLERAVVHAVASEGWRCPPGRRQYIPVVATRVDEAPGAAASSSGSPAGGGWVVRPAGPRGSGSHLAVTLAAANGLGVVDAAVEEVRPGDTVVVMLTGAHA